MYIVTERLIKTSTEQWGAPSRRLLEKVYNILAEKVTEVLDDHFLPFRYGRLHQNVKLVWFLALCGIPGLLTCVCCRSIINEVLAERRASALRKIDHLLVIENKAPYTVHESEYEEYGERYMESYLDAQPVYESDYNPSRPHQFAAAVDQCSQALRYMANSRAYFQGPHHSFPPPCLSVWGADQYISRIQEVRGYGSADDR